MNVIRELKRRLRKRFGEEWRTATVEAVARAALLELAELGDPTLIRATLEELLQDAPPLLQDAPLPTGQVTVTWLAPAAPPRAWGA